MAISLGSLYIELKANTAQFLDGMTKAATNSKAFARDVQGGLEKVGELVSGLGPIGERLSAVFENLGRSTTGVFAGLRESGALLTGLTAVGGGAAALGGTLFELANKASEAGAKIFEVSEKTGIAAPQLSGLMALSKETGEDFDALSTALARAGANLHNAIALPGSASAKILAQVLGGSKALSEEGLKPMGDRLQDVLKHIFDLNDVGQRNAALSALLGRGWMQNVETLKLLAEQGFGPAEAAARRLGIYFDGDAARQAKEFQVSLSEMKGELSGLALSVGQKALPAFEKFVVSLAAIGNGVKEFGLRLLAVTAASTGLGFPLAIKLWKEANQVGADSTKVMTDVLLRAQELTKGEQAQADEVGNHLAPNVKEYRDTLVSLIDSEQSQLAMLKAHGDRAAEAAVQYGEAMGEIRAASGSAAERAKAGAIAFEIFYQKIRELSGPAKIQFSERGPVAPSSSIADLPALLNMPGFPPPNVIADTGKQVNLLTQGLWKLQDALVAQGNDFGSKFLSGLMSAVDQAEDDIAKRIVTGKRVDFRQILPQFEEGLIKFGLQKGVGTIAGLFGGKGAGSKPDGTPGNPLHVVMATAGSSLASGAGGLGQVVHSMSSSLSGIFSKIFGGFLAGGGDVSPGKAYVVGERHPEFFVPKQSGYVANKLAVGGQVNVHNHFYGLTDVDSFRRSGAQIMGDIHRSTALALARNS